MLNTKLYFITDSNGYSEEQILSTIRQSLEAGASLIQLREKTKPDRQVIDLARKIKKITDEFEVPLIIDDRLDVAMIVGCHLHLGQNDIPIDDARKILGPDKIIGATAKTVDQALEAEKQGASYLGVGAIYDTTTKVITKRTSVDTLKEIVQSVSIPVNAIGGLNKDNLGILKDTGISGICVVSAIMKSEDPYKETKLLLKAIDEINLKK